jgi:hypothetical protein
MNQLRRIVVDSASIVDEASGDDGTTVDVNVIVKKLVGYRQQDIKNDEFDINAELIITLRQQQNNHCASCNCIMRWRYSDKDPRQFTVDRKDNNLGHIFGNVRLTCLECNRRNGAS